MKSKFINFSNHPSSSWMTKQLDEAKLYGDIIDVAFPMIPDNYCHTEVIAFVNQYLQQILQVSDYKPCTVHIMGEMTFTYAMVNALKTKGYTCVASTTKRIVEELPDGVKNVKFEFCQFREY